MNRDVPCVRHNNIYIYDGTVLSRTYVPYGTVNSTGTVQDRAEPIVFEIKILKVVSGIRKFVILKTNIETFTLHKN